MAKPPEENGAFFNSLHTLRMRVKDGTFSEIIDDWRWIFGYTKRYKWAVLFYTMLGIVSTTFGLVASVASITATVVTICLNVCDIFYIQLISNS